MFGPLGVCLQEFFFLLCESLMLSLCVGYLLVITET